MIGTGRGDPATAGGRERSPAVQRVKVGLTGLALVVLLIVIASAIMRTASHEAPVGAVGAAKPDVVANMAVPHGPDVAEPIAELGVAPVGGNQTMAHSTH